MDQACDALGAAHRGTMQAGEWESVNQVLAAMVPDFAREGSEEERDGISEGCY